MKDFSRVAIIVVVAAMVFCFFQKVVSLEIQWEVD